MTETIVMFDMDGTLTEPRQTFDSKVLEQALYKLTNSGVHIGIITGSDEDYLKEQMEVYLSRTPSRYKIHLMPCNGTKYLKPPQFAHEDFKLVYDVSMEQHLGKKNYKNLIYELILSQVDMANSDIPLTGHFINCRGSMINWCPIGRNANSQEREEFIDIDKRTGLRGRVIEELKMMLGQKGLLSQLTIKFGGDTSFDIYPKGWDKTYGLRHFQGWDVWFVGDRTCVNGNDYEIYNACSVNSQAFTSYGPAKTAQIIETILVKMRGEK